MPSDDWKSNYNDKDDDSNESENDRNYDFEDYDSDEEMFKKYSRKESGKPGKDSRRNEPEYSESNEDDEFFKDSDFEFRSYTDNEEDEDGLRSSKVKEQRRKRKLILSTVGIMCILVVIAIGIVFGYRFIKNKYFGEAADSGTNTEESINIPSTIKLAKDMNIVISFAGQDLLEPDVYSVMFSKYTASESEMINLCLPVNTLFEIPGFGLDSIAQSVIFGGMDLLKLTIKDNIGLDVTNYLLFDVANTVNELEGIKINLDSAVTISGASGSQMELKQGENILNGETALMFLQYFSGSNPDVEAQSVKNQKLILDGLMAKLTGTEEGQLSQNLTKINDFVDTDLSLEELSELISTFSTLEAEKNAVFALDGRMEPVDDSGSLVYVPDISKVSDIFNQQINVVQEASQETGETYNVLILNGVGTKGIAGKASDILKDLKYPDGTPRYIMGDPADADNYNYEKTKIVLKSADETLVAAAESLKGFLLAGEITDQPLADQQSDIVVIIGKDFNYDAAVEAQSQAAETASTDAYEETAAQSSEEASGEIPAGQTYDVVILNGEGTQGIALTLKEILEKELNTEGKAVNIKETKNADSFNYNVSKILVHTDKEGAAAMAGRIQDVMGVGTVSESDSNPDNTDITIIIGSDFTK